MSNRIRRRLVHHQRQQCRAGAFFFLILFLVGRDLFLFLFANIQERQTQQMFCCTKKIYD